MKKIQMSDLSLWQFENLEKEPSIKHFVTDRRAKGESYEFTLSYSSSPDKAIIQSNRDLLARAMGVLPEYLFFPSQVHNTRVVRVSKDTSREELMDTDALITNKKGVCIAVMSADCVPILLYDKKNAATGAIHSGWRGTVARILAKTLEEMQIAYGTKGEDLIACIGPSVCQDSYEVGEEVVQAFQKEYGDKSELMIPQPHNPKKARLDLWKANKIQLLEFGVPEPQIEISDLCTVKNNESFFSARKGDAGRFAAGIMLV